MAGLVMEEYRQDSPPSRPIDLVPELTAGWKETDSFIVDAVQADPEMAGEYYHVESMKFVGSSGRFAAFSFVAESYLGGAHPVESRRLIVVDMEAGRVVDPLPMFGDRDLVREVLKDRFEAACVRKPSGVGFLEGSGGKPVPVLLLTADRFVRSVSVASVIRLRALRIMHRRSDRRSDSRGRQRSPPASSISASRMGAGHDGMAMGTMMKSCSMVAKALQGADRKSASDGWTRGPSSASSRRCCPCSFRPIRRQQKPLPGSSPP